MVSDTDRNLARVIGNLLVILDKLTIPDNPIKIIELIQNKSKLNKRGNRHHFHYNFGKNKSDERYRIFAKGLSKYLEDLVKNINNPNQLMQYVLILTILGHEIRHRLQRFKLVELFSVKNIKSISFFKNEKISCLEESFKNKILGGNPIYEFDSKIIELLIVRRVTSDNKKIIDLRTIAEIILTTPSSMKI